MRLNIFAPLLLEILACGASVAQTGGAFVPAGNMTVSRSGHTATLLPDGRVLIAGGYTISRLDDPPAFLASAELFDPSTGAFSSTGSMTVPRSGHSATLLPNGTVLIAGGNAHSASELYDPAAGTFRSTGVLDDPRDGLAVTMQDGRILFVYGAQTYDPSTGLFTATASPLELPFGGGDTTASPLTDGTVLLTQPNELRGELYEPRTGTYQITNGIRDPWVAGSATLLLNGEVLLAGGNDPYEIESALAELYNPSDRPGSAGLQAGQFFFPIGNLTVVRANHSSTLLPDGTVLIAGSWGDDGSGIPFSLPSAELYDPAARKFTRTGDMNVSRGFHTATLLNDGRVLIVGGVLDWTSRTTPATELYTEASVIPAPVLFSVAGNGQGQGAVWHAATGLIASSAGPAVAGEILSMYTTNLAPGGVIQPRVAVGGQAAAVTYFGAAPGYPGFFQINFRVPNGVAPGPSVPLRLTYLDRSANVVTIGLQ